MINKGRTIQIMQTPNEEFEFNLGFAKVSRSIKKVNRTVREAALGCQQLKPILGIILPD